jgi:hypothetical protein
MSRDLRNVVMVSVVMALVLAGCARPEPTAKTGPPAGWRSVADVPLSPRQGAHGLWTGREVLLIGGSDADICPPAADCRGGDSTPLTDGTAFDPATGAWRPIAPPPAPLDNPSSVMLGQTAYFLQSAHAWSPIQKLFAYDVAADTWRTYSVPLPTDTAPAYDLVAAGDRLVALHGSDESTDRTPGPDLIFDPAPGEWRELPEDPLGPAFDRNAAWFKGELIVFEHKLVPSPGAVEPSLVRSAALNLATEAWRVLPDVPMLYTGPWMTIGSRLVNPSLGSADGGEVGNWGRGYPYGGALDPATGRFTPLPAAPGQTETTASAGVVTADSALYLGAGTFLLDATTDSWITVPPLPEGQVSGYTTVTAGTDLFIFGGGVWPGPDGKGKLLNSVWLWSPR